MKEITVATVGGLKAPIQVYETYHEADAIVPNGLLEQANLNMVYRQVLPVVREAICNLVEEKSGIARESKVVGKTKTTNKDIIQWEADGAYINRVLAQQGKDDFTELQSEVDAICRSYQDEDDKKNNVPGKPLAVNIKGAERKPPEPKKLATKHKLMAAKILTLGTLKAANKQFGKAGIVEFSPSGDQSKTYTGTFPPDFPADLAGKSFSVSDKDAEDLGWKVKGFGDWHAAQASSSL